MKNKFTLQVECCKGVMKSVCGILKSIQGRGTSFQSTKAFFANAGKDWTAIEEMPLCLLFTFYLPKLRYPGQDSKSIELKVSLLNIKSYLSCTMLKQNF